MAINVLNIDGYYIFVIINYVIYCRNPRRSWSIIFNKTHRYVYDNNIYGVIRIDREDVVKIAARLLQRECFLNFPIRLPVALGTAVTEIEEIDDLFLNFIPITIVIRIIIQYLIVIV